MAHRLRITGLLTALLLLMVVGCGQENEAGGAEQPASFEGPPLIIAVLPYIAPSGIAQRFQPLANYLERKLERPVDLHFSRDYAEPLRLLADGQVDMAYLGPSELVRLERRYPGNEDLRLVAVESAFRAVVVVRRDDEWASMADLAGHTFAFGSHRSFTSHFAARYMLAEAGIGLSDLVDYAHLHHQEHILLAVLHGDYDAGALSEGVAQQYLARHPGLRVLAYSEPLPAPGLVAGPSMDEAMEARIRELLVAPLEELGSLESEDVIIPRYLPGFHRPDSYDHDRTREYIDRVERPCRGEGA